MPRDRRKPARGTPLTEIEREVLYWISHGYPDREIARKTFRSVNTIKTIIVRTYARLGANGRTHATRLGFELGYLERSEANESMRT